MSKRFSAVLPSGLEERSLSLSESAETVYISPHDFPIRDEGRRISRIDTSAHAFSQLRSRRLRESRQPEPSRGSPPGKPAHDRILHRHTLG